MWDLQKINEYIENGIEENLHLDYKAAGSLGKSDGKKKEISKDVSAFANSGGGVIIYGVSEFDEPGKNHLPKEITPINRLEFSKEWLEQVINSNIAPRIQNIKITPISYGSPENNETIYVIEIPQSETAHQAKDKKYYKRYNFESIAMEDYEIKDIINRSNKTNIVVTFEPSITKEFYEKIIAAGGQYKFNTKIWAHNRGNLVARFLEVYISGNSEVANFIVEPTTKNDKEFELIFSNTEERKITLNSDDFVISKERVPIMPKTYRAIGQLVFYSDIITNDLELTLLISTEDGSKLQVLKGEEIFEGK